MPKVRYTEDEKREAVRRIVEGHEKAVDVADEMKVHQSQIHQWKKKFAGQKAATPEGTGLEADIHRLDRELAALKSQVLGHVARAKQCVVQAAALEERALARARALGFIATEPGVPMPT